MNNVDSNITTIEAGKLEKAYWLDLWKYRELFFFLAWKDVLVRYKQTMIGITWALIRPVLTMIVFTLVFGKLANLPSDNVPYPILVFAGLLPWQFFSTAFAEAGNSLISNANMISKIYFPRMIIPVSAIIVTLVDFLISFFILVILMFWYGYQPSLHILLLPLFILMSILAALGAGLWIAALNVEYRDFRFIIPFILQFGLYISPIGFSSSIIPEKWKLLYSINPMVGIIDGFRWAILGHHATSKIYLPGLYLSLSLILLILITGIRFFRNTERSFADVI
ncbi:ABC transporter permease [Methylophilus glucosoxydans]|uniref:Transport permease protein n=1 Tax=Methylophilus glucosoxydans TaxID=752553 RepID=A0ABW3GID5_9PROT